MEFNSDDELKCYYQGILDACEYFKNLGVEDAMETDMAIEAKDWIGYE